MVYRGRVGEPTHISAHASSDMGLWTRSHPTPSERAVEDVLAGPLGPRQQILKAAMEVLAAEIQTVGGDVAARRCDLAGSGTWLYIPPDKYPASHPALWGPGDLFEKWQPLAATRVRIFCLLAKGEEDLGEEDLGEARSLLGGLC